MDILELKQLAQNYSVLYVEDEDDTREMVSKILERFFHTVVTANNGESGFHEFMHHHPDLVITDIKMPTMSGLDMANMIRETHKEIPIIVTSAFNDTNFLVTAIEAKIDFFVFKPLSTPKMLETLERVLLRLEEKKRMEEYQRKEALYRLNNASLHAIYSTMEGFTSPSLLICDNQPLYLNKAWEKFLDKQWIDCYISGQTTLDSLIISKESYAHSLKELSHENSHIILHYKGQQHLYFIVQMKDVMLESSSSTCRLYTFTDVTMLEYQKNKLSTMNKLLKEFMVANYYSCPTPPRSLSQSSVKESTLEPRRFLSDDESEVLRRNHKQCYTADEYVRELDTETLQELQELIELEKELIETIDIFEMDKSSHLLTILSHHFLKYASTLKLLIEFNDLCFALHSIAELLTSQTHSSLDDKKASKIALYTRNIISELQSWRHVLFIEKNAVDIHYLDSSLFSVCLQLEMTLSHITPLNHEEEDFLELF